MIMATFSCAVGKVILFCEDNKYRVRLEDDCADSMGEDEYAEFLTFEDAQEQFLADTEQLLVTLNDSPGDWGGN